MDADSSATNEISKGRVSVTHNQLETLNLAQEWELLVDHGVEALTGYAEANNSGAIVPMGSVTLRLTESIGKTDGVKAGGDNPVLLALRSSGIHINEAK